MFNKPVHPKHSWFVAEEGEPFTRAYDANTPKFAAQLYAEDSRPTTGFFGRNLKLRVTPANKDGTHNKSSVQRFLVHVSTVETYSVYPAQENSDG